ncbi:Flp family type IVb pilin [Dietzia cinnamea]|uniref:Pilus assembly protein Flp/PilA n=1 Tax=Dietzia cinnamea TaxID=321318 RepID=A0A4R3ZY57_9ACTN|nr:Flp family type IVb pilin [Dietzia cinnamea]TCW25836.1 pilus assembly protein Flp/PilA [Dietzia cinnamea]
MNQLYFAMATMQAFFSERLDNRKDRGATAVEYGLMVGLIAVAIIAIVVVLGDQLAALFTEVTTELEEPSGVAGAGGGA